jgi:hypothetical protein
MERCAQQWPLSVHWCRVFGTTLLVPSSPSTTRRWAVTDLVAQKFITTDVTPQGSERDSAMRAVGSEEDTMETFKKVDAKCEKSARCLCHCPCEHLLRVFFFWVHKKKTLFRCCWHT